MHVKGIIVAIAGVGAVLSGLVGWYTTYNAVKTSSQPSTSGATGDVDSIYPLSIMVLPFANQTGDVAKGYVADALTSNITSDLSRIRDTMVMAPAQAYAYKDKAVNLQQIGREAGVRFILQGALQASAEKVRVAVQLADASNGTLLWNETIEGDMVDLFALQDKVTQRVSVSIGPAMIVSSARASETRKGNLRAVDAVLRAKALELQPVSMENYKKMQDFYRQALKLEPENVIAQYGLARALSRWRGNFVSKLSAEQLFTAEREIQALTASVVQSEPDSPRSRSLLANIAGMKGDCVAIMDAAVARVAAEPTDASALFNLGHAKAVMGLPREGIPAYKRALELSPKFGASHAYYGLGTAYVMLGEPDAAIPWLLKSTQIEPNFFDLNAWLAIAYELKGDKEQVKAQMARLKILAPDFRAKDMDKPGSI